MKRVWPSIACSAVLLSGCMYGTATAPITALNSQSGQYQQGNMQQPARQPVGQIHEQRGRTMVLAPSRVPSPTRPVPVASPAHGQVPAGGVVAPRSGVVAQAPSPYAQPPVTQPTRPQPPLNTVANNNDGWSVTPQVQTPPTQVNTDTASATAAQQSVNTPPAAAQPVRPSEAQPTATAASSAASNAATTETAPVANAQESAPNTQVASAAPLAQSTSPKEETAVSALLKKASSSLGKGDLDGAAAYLENAQRIEPQNAKILYDIANIRYHQGRYKDAETFAGRAVQVGGGNAMMKKSWALVANARKSLGDNQGAIAAAEKAASFGN